MLEVLQCLPYVVSFLRNCGVEDSLGSGCQGANDAKFSSKNIETVSLQVLIYMSGLPIRSC